MDSQKMDPHGQDALGERRREEALARRMGEALDRLSTPEANDCPEADVIAAYYERALGPEEIAQYEDHFAGCARCRKILTVLAASVDAPLAEKEVARLGELVAAAERSPNDAASRSSNKITQIRPSRWDWRVRWLAPALGVAAALAIWFAVRPPWRGADQHSSGTLIAQAPKDETPPNAEPSLSDRLSEAAPQLDKKAAAPGSRDRSAINTPSVNSPAEAQAKGRGDTGNATGAASPNSDAAANAFQQEQEKESNAMRSEAAPAPSAPPPPPAPLPQSKTEALPPVVAPQARASAGGIVAGVGGGAAPRDSQPPAPQPAAGAMAGSPASPRAAMSALNGRNLSELKTLSEAPALASSPSGSTIWRAGKGGSIERSTDAGRTYTTQASPSQEDWLAIAAVSDTIGWLAGRNGAIAKTTDGERWERVAPPSQAADSTAKFPDWIGITAQSAQSVTITARDGRRFATQDGGKTWRPQ